LRTSLLPTVQVNRKAAQRVASGHPWIFTSDVTDRGSAAGGDAVEVLDPKGRSLGVAHFSAASQITLRMLSSRAEAVDRAFIEARLDAAIGLRERVVRNSNAYRVVSSEGDLLPGLIVDRYGEWLTVQLLTQGMDAARELVIEVVKERFQPKGIVLRNDAAVRKLENLPQGTEVLFGENASAVAVHMNGLEWQVDLVGGQKTGIYLDQRENYLAAAKYARGRALDCFTSTGGFAMHLAQSCDEVLGIDSSEAAIDSARRTAERNGLTNLRFEDADAFDRLAGLEAQRRRFDVVVVDPPAFAKSRAQVEGAARGYKELNLRALKLLEHGGLLVTCSCSHHFSEAALLEIVAEASLDARRTLRVLERRTQASDHPILLTVPETLYLKCLILQVLN
jgi:23S rRNA (cytosine1962-C5)-methyltransferase